MRFGGTKKHGDMSPTRFSASVGRATLRRVLFDGLGDVVHFSKGFARYERLEDNRIRAHFNDASSADASLLIDADGAGSRVRQQLLPEATLRDPGQRTIFGKTKLDDATRPLLPAFLHDGFGAVIGTHQRGMALGLMQFQTWLETITVTARLHTRLRPTPDYLTWALTVPVEQLPEPDATMHTLGGLGFLKIAQALTEEWHPDLRTLLAASDTTHIAFTPIRLATPVSPWETTNITLPCDAIHTRFHPFALPFMLVDKLTKLVRSD